MEIILDLMQEGNYQEALEVILQEKKTNGNSDILAILEATIWQELGNREVMWEAISQGLLCNPQNYELMFMLGDYYYPVNKQQAWLCYENAKFYCRLEEDSKLIQARMDELEEQINPPAKAAIVILSYNSLDMTKNCIASIRENCSRESYELIVIDNASGDGSAEWLKTQQDIKLLCNAENQGFPKGCNQGIELAEPESDIFLLNNDTLMMPNALFWLRMGLYEETQVGACGSVSNSAGNHQKIQETYENVGGYLKYALRNNIPQKYPYEERMYLIGFAMLIRREAVDKVGLLDEQFSPGNFEDTDYGVRLIQAGYRNRVCKNSFIFHWGGQSFGKKQERYIALIEKNKKIFEEKWQEKYSEYSSVRTDIIGKMNVIEKEEPIRVLDLECGYGMTLAKIQSEYPKAERFGITKKQKKAEIAARYATVVQGNIESITLEREWGKFDYIIAGEVLENLTEPEKFLQKIRNSLKAQGKLLVSVSDMEHWTEQSLRKVLEDAGYQVENVWFYKVPGEKLEICQILMEVKLNDNGQPLVSVIIPTYNRAHCIEKAVESVLKQNYENMEILIVDDGSTDDTEVVIKNIGDARIRYHKISCNSGASVARNVGIRLAKGKYIAFQDSDDVWLAGKLKQQVEILENSNYGMVYGCFEREFPDGRVEKVPRDEIQQEAKQGSIYPYLLAESYISTQTMLVRKEILQQLQGFDEALKSYEDYDLSIRIAKCCQVAFMDEVLVHLNTLPDSIDMDMMRGLISSCYLLKKYEEDLKKYDIYERKYKVIMDFAETAGCKPQIEKFLA